MKIIIANDKFKGTLTSMEVCRAIQSGLYNVDAKLLVSMFPMADGGDGFASVMKLYTSTETRVVKSDDALGREISSAYELSHTEATAIIELATCSGLAMLAAHDRNPLHTSTYDTSLQIVNVLKQGARKIILGIGSSATNDAGTGYPCCARFSVLRRNRP